MPEGGRDNGNSTSSSGSAVTLLGILSTLVAVCGSFVSGCAVYAFSFSIGIALLPWVIMSEIFPINEKGSGGSLVTLANWFSSWVGTYAFNFLFDWSFAGVFFIFGGFCEANFLFIATLVPETKGGRITGIARSFQVT